MSPCSPLTQAGAGQKVQEAHSTISRQCRTVPTEQQALLGQFCVLHSNGCLSPLRPDNIAYSCSATCSCCPKCWCIHSLVST